jgi:peptidoglycan/LPS O-acetylase OafA/YrhL
MGMSVATESTRRLSGRHVAPLDGLRGIAILIVMLHHFEFLLPGHSWVATTVKGMFYAGWSGVDLFFVLSGFLITGILIDTKDAKNYFSSFYARRILRIFPLYYSVLSVIVIAARLLYQPWFDNLIALRPDQIYYFFYLNNWMILLKGAWHANIIGHFWSLAVEEQFYAIWPMCIWLLPKRYLLRMTFAGCVFALALRIGLVAAYGPSQALVQNTFARMDTLLAGASCAVIVRSESMVERIRPWLIPAMILAAAGIFWIDIFQEELRMAGIYTETIGFSFLAVGYAALLLRVFLGQGSGSIGQKVFGGAVLKATGKYSYGIYVLHVPILMTANLFFNQALALGVNAWTSIPFVVGLMGVSFVAAKASYELFEQRFLRMKGRFEPRFGPSSLTVAPGATALSGAGT